MVSTSYPLSFVEQPTHKAEPAKEGVIESALTVISACSVRLQESELNASFLRAAKRGDPLTICMLLQQVSPQIIRKALRRAYDRGHLDIVEDLLKLSASIAWKTPDDPLKNDLLFLFVEAKNSGLVQLLLESGADVNARNSLGKTPLDLARSPSIIELLVRKGADLSVKDFQNNTPLHRAVMNDDVTLVKLLLECGADINVKNSLGKTPLALAYDTKVIELLVRKGADISFKDSQNNTLLHRAAQQGNLTLAQLLLERGADVNAKNSLGKTPLVLTHNRDLIELLVRKGADPSVKDSDNNTPLHWAVMNQDIALVKLLLERGADVNAKNFLGKTPLALTYDTKVIELLVRKGADIFIKDSENITLLHRAAQAGNLTLTQLLLERGADVNAKNFLGKTPLALTHSRDLIELLIRKGADLSVKDSQNNPLLHCAVMDDNVILVQLLLDSGADVNGKGSIGYPPLALTRNTKVIELLVRKGADLSFKDSQNNTLLHWAAQVGSLTLTQLLLERRIGVNVRNSLGETALDLALTNHAPAEVFRLLIEKGADLSFKDSQNNTLLHRSVQAGNLTLTQLLLERGINVNARNSKGETALDLALTNHAPIEVLRLLIEKGADLSVKDSENNTLLHRSVQAGDLTLTQLLLARGINVNASNSNGETALDLAVKKRASEEILRLLVENEAILPKGHDNLDFLKIKQPKVEAIEYYDEQRERFSLDVSSFTSQIRASKKEAAVLLYAEYDHHPSSPYFGAVTQYYDRGNSVTQCHTKLSKHFTVFRARVSSSQQIVPALEKIKAVLGSEREISHLKIQAHASPSAMGLGASGRYRHLVGEDAENNFAMTEACRHIKKEGTIALSGCSTAEGGSNIAQKLSHSKVAGGRVIFGAPLLNGGVSYKIIYYLGKPIALPTFEDDPTMKHVAAYKDGEEIAKGQWVSMHSKL